MHAPRSLVGYRTRRGGALAGCLIALGVVVVIVIAGGVFVWMNLRGWTASLMNAGSERLVATMNLDEVEEAEVLAELKAVTAAFEAGDITLEDGKRILEEIATSPVAPALLVAGVHSEYFEPSGLSDEEKQGANVAMSRLARGVYEGSIEPEALEAVFAPISTTSTTGKGVHINSDKITLNLKAPEDVTDEQLREVVALAQQHAADAEVPDEVLEIDASEEIAKAIETALGRRLTPEPVGDAEPAGDDGP